MGRIKTLNKWANAHTYYPLDLLRIFLGIFLFYQAVVYMGNTDMLMNLVTSFSSFDGMILIHYIGPAHFIGGILIAIGLLTRWAIIAQLPILIGALLSNFFGVMNTTNLLLSIAILALCTFFLVYGSGKHSVDKYLRMEK